MKTLEQITIESKQVLTEFESFINQPDFEFLCYHKFNYVKTALDEFNSKLKELSKQTEEYFRTIK